MTLEQINNLTFEDAWRTLLERTLDFSEVYVGEDRYWLSEDEDKTLFARIQVHSSLPKPTKTSLLDELEVYKAELIAAEEARIKDLKDRFNALSDKGRVQGSSNIQNPAAYFRDEILNNSDKVQAESKLAALESAYAQAEAEISSNEWLRNRESEYAKIDSMLLEALAEKEAGRPEKMQEYLTLRAQIRADHPKP